MVTTLINFVVRVEGRASFGVVSGMLIAHASHVNYPFSLRRMLKYRETVSKILISAVSLFSRRAIYKCRDNHRNRVGGAHPRHRVLDLLFCREKAARNRRRRGSGKGLGIRHLLRGFQGQIEGAQRRVSVSFGRNRLDFVFGREFRKKNAHICEHSSVTTIPKRNYDKGAGMQLNSANYP